MKALSMFALAAVLTAAMYFGFSEPTKKVTQDFEPQPSSLAALPTLEDEQTPFFSRQVKTEDGHKVEEILCYRRDKTIAHLYFAKNGLLSKVLAYRYENDQKKLAYEAQYNEAGRQIKSARYYAPDGELESEHEHHDNGSATHSFYKEANLLQRVDLAVDGSCTKENYKNGKLQSTTKLDAPVQRNDLVHWDSAKKDLRLRVELRGASLSSWEYFSKEDGSLEHSGKVLADGTLEFSYVQKGKLKVRQLWMLVGEDWERSYYGLSYAETFADDGKTVDHKLWLRSNGSLKRHERYDGKTGQLEMQRDFDQESRVERVEDFKKDGSSERVWIFPASDHRSRGFTPTGMRDYPGEAKGIPSVYNLDGQPFSHSVLDRHPWAFFELPEQTQGKN